MFRLPPDYRAFAQQPDCVHNQLFVGLSGRCAGPVSHRDFCPIRMSNIAEIYASRPHRQIGAVDDYAEAPGWAGHWPRSGVHVTPPNTARTA